MKNLIYLSFIMMICISSCKTKNLGQNQYSNFPDTLILSTQKVKGCGLFSPGAATIHFQNPENNKAGLKFNIPDTFKKPEVGIIMLDIKPYVYKMFLQGDYDSLTFMTMVNQFNVDTTKIPPEESSRNYLSILKTNVNGNNVIVVDQNNNRDFSDDTIRSINQIDWKSSLTPIEFVYDVYNGSTIVPSHSWINLGYYNKDQSEIIYFFSEYLTTSFTINKKTYSLAVLDNQVKCVYLDPRIALTEDNGKVKDTLLLSDIYKLREYVKIDTKYYQFQSISNDGSIIKLIKENEFENKVGTQVGMKAPNFNLTAINKKYISLTDYKNKYLLISNITSCWSMKDIYKSYKALTDSLGQRLQYLCIDFASPAFPANIKEYDLAGDFVVLNNDNRNEVINSYRPGISSRECFLISPDGRIVDKFQLFDWESHLLQISDITKFK